MDSKGTSFFDFFKEIPDHRMERCKLHSVSEILLLTFCGVMADCDSWEAIEDFGQIKLEYLRQYFRYKYEVSNDFIQWLDDNFVEGIITKDLIEENDTILLALSGGRDSLALLYLLQRNNGEISL